jgi:molecular chaperone GrpE (heat shock protein)
MKATQKKTLLKIDERLSEGLDALLDLIGEFQEELETLEEKQGERETDARTERIESLEDLISELEDAYNDIEWSIEKIRNRIE